jgi:hypothetical protein
MRSVSIDQKKRPKMKKSATKRSKSAAKREQVIVLKDGVGNYYTLPRAMIERARVNRRRKKKIEKELEDEDCITTWIKRATIPGSIAAAAFKGGRALHYAGYYLRKKKSKV